MISFGTIWFLPTVKLSGCTGKVKFRIQFVGKCELKIVLMCSYKINCVRVFVELYRKFKLKTNDGHYTFKLFS